MLPRLRNGKKVVGAKAKSKKPETSAGRRSWPGLKLEELKGLAAKIQQKFGWAHTPRPFQIEAIEAQLLRKDVLIHAGTGSGKTAVAAGPFAHEKTAGMVSFMVSPLVALQEEQVKTFRHEFKLKATAVNHVSGGCTQEVMDSICRGDWQIVVISPEMMLAKPFIKEVLRNPALGARILSVIIDEAHVISHWGSSFRKQYGTLGILRALLPKKTSIVAMSATLPPRVRKDVLNKLQFDQKNYVNINLGNDRPNVSLVIRAIQNPMNTYSDLDFIIPDNITDRTQIKQTMIYVDSISDSVDGIENRLYERIPEHIRDENIIRPFNALYTPEHRSRLMELFRAGIVRVLICTDVAGMGCNIPGVDMVVQWKLPATVSSFVQRAGRAARVPGHTGLAVLLVEKSVYDADLTDLSEAVSKEANLKRKGVRQSATYPKATKTYAITHGSRRGGHDPAFDDDLGQSDVPLDHLSIDEGLFSLVQTTKCRRAILTKIYGNTEPVPTAPCCDICDPTLLNLTRPAPPQLVTRKKAVKVGMPNMVVADALHEWRRSIWQRDFPDAIFGPSGILKDETMMKLSSVGPKLTLAELEDVVGESWEWFGKYGDSLLAKLVSLSIPPMIPKPTKTKTAKRAQNEGGETGDVAGEASGSKRRRKNNEARGDGGATASTLTAVNQPTMSSTMSSTTSSLTTHTQVSPPHPSTPLARNPYSHYSPWMTQTPAYNTPSYPFLPYYPQQQPMSSLQYHPQSSPLLPSTSNHPPTPQNIHFNPYYMYYPPPGPPPGPPPPCS